MAKFKVVVKILGPDPKGSNSFVEFRKNIYCMQGMMLLWRKRSITMQWVKATSKKKWVVSSRKAGINFKIMEESFMLHIIVASKNLSSNKNNELERHIGDDLPILTNEEVIEVHATGSELEFIIQNFECLPKAFHNFQSHDTPVLNLVQRWFGDHAKFIYHNLQW